MPNEPAPAALRRPPALAPGARVALVAPAGPLRGAADLERAVENARRLGWEPVPSGHALDRRGYFAGHDADRLADLNAALADDAVDGVWCLRGGYGAMRLLDRVDYDALRRHPKPVVGYSDITALHAAIGRQAGVTTFHGPTARAVLSPFSRDSLVRAVSHATDPCGGDRTSARTLRRGRARGVLVGGNLALLAALAGTPYAPNYEGAILVLEDVNEAVYRVDRMLRQLLLAGALRGLRGIAFGHCTDCPPESDDGARALDEVVAELADTLAVPCAIGLPVGHVDDQWTVPLGAVAELDADRGALHVEW
jgi:muramoyltetrapeptide carboxypeptidase